MAESCSLSFRVILVVIVVVTVVVVIWRGRGKEARNKSAIGTVCYIMFGPSRSRKIMHRYNMCHLIEKKQIPAGLLFGWIPDVRERGISCRRTVHLTRLSPESGVYFFICTKFLFEWKIEILKQKSKIKN